MAFTMFKKNYNSKLLPINALPLIPLIHNILHIYLNSAPLYLFIRKNYFKNNLLVINI